jgi:putative thioredoxin
MSQQTPYIFDATTADFDQSVIEASFQKPVLVDFWAEWCAPCKALMPMLQGIAESYQGELLLAKVNCDVEPDIVARFGILSLPTVVLFKDGQPVDGFAGAQPESAVRALLEPHVQMPPPVAADPFEQAQALFDEGRYADAEATLVVLLNEDNTNAKALILYARCLTERGELDEAQAVLDAVKSDDHKAALAGAKAQIKFLGLARMLLT